MTPNRRRLRARESSSRSRRRKISAGLSQRFDAIAVSCVGLLPQATRDVELPVVCVGGVDVRVVHDFRFDGAERARMIDRPDQRRHMMRRNLSASRALTGRPTCCSAVMPVLAGPEGGEATGPAYTTERIVTRATAAI